MEYVEHAEPTPEPISIARCRERLGEDASSKVVVTAGSERRGEVGQQHVDECRQPELSRQAQRLVDRLDARVVVAAHRSQPTDVAVGERGVDVTTDGIEQRNAGAKCLDGVSVAIFDECTPSDDVREHRPRPRLRVETGQDLLGIPQQIPRLGVVAPSGIGDGERCLDPDQLVEARAIKTGQEVERIRLANEIAAAAMDHVRGLIRPGMTEAQIAAEWLGFVHGEGTGWAGQVELALGFSLVWAGPGIRTFTATSNRPVLEGEPTLFEIWVCADGYWADHTKNVVVGELTAPYVELEAGLRGVYDDAVAFCTPGASLAELDRRIREGIERIGYPGQPSHPICHGVGARAHEPPYPHQAAGGELRAGMVLAIEPGCYWEGGGGLRLEDNWLVTEGAPEKLCSFPDGIVEAR